MFVIAPSLNLKTDADRFAKNIAPVIREIQSSGVARGGVWTAVQVGSILRRVETH
jgi:hypothetical protein